jgi:hypothetical protein
MEAAILVLSKICPGTQQTGSISYRIPSSTLLLDNIFSSNGKENVIFYILNDFKAHKFNLNIKTTCFAINSSLHSQGLMFAIYTNP